MATELPTAQAMNSAGRNTADAERPPALPRRTRGSATGAITFHGGPSPARAAALGLHAGRTVAPGPVASEWGVAADRGRRAARSISGPGPPSAGRRRIFGRTRRSGGSQRLQFAP